MDLKSNHSSPVLTDSASMNSSGLGIHSNSFSPLGGVFPHGLLNVPRKKPAVLDWSNSWLDAMKSSSPTHRKIGMISLDIDTFYSNWKHKYPSAIGCFEQITSHGKGKIIALFLDYDGTLSPIVDNPDCAVMSPSMRSTVKNVAKLFPTAIISGRSRDKLYEFVGLPELSYAGSHGMDIKAPFKSASSKFLLSECSRSCNKQDKQVNLFQPASEFLPMIDKVLKSLFEIAEEIKGSKVENNKFCVSVHYRNVDEKNWAVVLQRVQEILEDYPRLQLTHGRKVLEIRPVLDWDKGKAVEFLLESLGLNDRDDVLPIYIGDDRTDEDAFKVLREGNRGYGILVSSVPKESNAAYSLRDPSEVMEFLKSLAAWKEEAKCTITTL